MYEKIAAYVGGKVLTAILVVAVAVTGYWFYKNPEQIQNLWLAVRDSLVWLGFVAILPWALFFLPGMAAKTDSNVAAIGLLIGYLALDILMALYLAEWSVGGTLTWSVFVLGFLVAAVYNFWVCDLLAERSEDAI